MLDVLYCLIVVGEALTVKTSHGEKLTDPSICPPSSFVGSLLDPHQLKVTFKVLFSPVYRN